MKHFLLLLFSIVIAVNINAQRQVDLNQTVQLEVEIDETKNQATLYWDNFSDVENYFVFKRNFGDDSWGPAQETLFGGDTSYVLENIEPANVYEFKVSRSASSGFAEGYVASGFEVSHNPFQNIMIFITEESITDSLESEIEVYKDHLWNEGWVVDHIIVSKDESPIEIRNRIISRWEVSNETPVAQRMIKSIFLFGHVPVPYSGVIGPDGHGNHIGAWPCDAYYGDMDGAWSDSFANNTTAAQSRNHNVPGDGKFDNSVMATDIEIPVGRVDFANMPVFEESEVELLRRYMEKNLNFRKGFIKSPDRGLIENNFNLAEGFGQNGIKNFTAFFGRDSVHFRDYDVLKSESYLWSYGAGGGNFQGASGISNTTNLSNDSLQTVFTMLFGSYFGDWDSSNNFLRAALASPGTCLSNAWAGRPNWMFHPMAMGYNLGDCTLISQNNSNDYVSGFGARQIHTALMGDPSLKMYYPEPARNLTATDIGGGTIELDWDISADTTVSHYFIYRSGSFPIIVPEKIAVVDKNTTTYLDSCLNHASQYDYFVSAAELKQTASGSAFFESSMVTDKVSVVSNAAPTADFNFNIDELEVMFENNSTGADSWHWDFGDNNFSDEQNPTHIYEDGDFYLVTLTVTNHCFTDSLSQVVEVESTNVEDLSQYHLMLFPNPVENHLNINCIDCYHSINVEIISLSGQSIQNIEIRPGLNSFDLSFLPKGIYLLRTLNQKEITYTRFSKM